MRAPQGCAADSGDRCRTRRALPSLFWLTSSLSSMWLLVVPLAGGVRDPPAVHHTWTARPSRAAVPHGADEGGSKCPTFSSSW
jgi:hypothetical protein